MSKLTSLASIIIVAISAQCQAGSFSSLPNHKSEVLTGYYQLLEVDQEFKDLVLTSEVELDLSASLLRNMCEAGEYDKFERTKADMAKTAASSQYNTDLEFKANQFKSDRIRIEMSCVI